jgi:hypothetical protein
MLLRYTDQWDMDQQLERIKGRLSNQEGISMEEFKSFFFFLNNLEDFATAIHYYALANQPIGTGSKRGYHTEFQLFVYRGISSSSQDFNGRRSQ